MISFPLKWKVSVHFSDVQASGTFIASFKIKPQKTGERELIVNFNCDQLEDVNGSCKITVS